MKKLNYTLVTLLLFLTFKLNSQTCTIDTLYEHQLVYSNGIDFEKKPRARYILNISNNNLNIEYIFQAYIPYLNKYRNFSRLYYENHPIYNQKRTLELSQYFDTVSNNWTNNYKGEISYNSKGKTLNSSYFQWNKTLLSWYKTNNITKSYISDTLVAEEISQNYVSHLSSLRNYSKYSYTYDINGNRLSEIQYEWDTVAINFIPYRRTSYTYNTDNQIVTEINEYWSKLNNRFDKYNKNENIYTLTKKLNISTYQIWDNAIMDYVNYSRKVLMYDANDLLYLELDEYYDNITSTWIYNYKTEIEYQSGNLPKSKTTSSYNSTSMTWTPNYLETFNYNATGKKIKEYYYQWLNATSEWQEKYLYINNYNSGDSIILSESYQRNEAINGLEIYFKEEFRYNKSNPISEVVEYRDFNNTLGYFEDVRLSQSYCRISNTNISSISSSKNTLYPNPSSGYIEININQNSYYEILGLDGRIIAKGIATPNNKIDISSLKSGVYMIKINQSNIKFIKE